MRTTPPEGQKVSDTGSRSLHSSLPWITSAQFVQLGVIGKNHPGGRWFCSFFAEEGDPDLYVQEIGGDWMVRIHPDGRWAYLGEGEPEVIRGKS